MALRINLSPFLGITLTLLFVFSTIYTLAFFYYQGNNQELSTNGLDDNDDSGEWNFDSLLGVISWLSPFGFIKLLLSGLMVEIPDLYQIIDMLLLRPLGWFVFIVQGNYLISLIPTVGKGE